MYLSKKLFLISAAVLGLTQVNCGPYIPYAYDEWVVEEPIAVVEASNPYYSYNLLTFKISWDPTPAGEDVIATLITPYNALVHENGPIVDGCYFAEVHDVSFDKRVATIQCEDPTDGSYDVQLENTGVFSQQVSVEVIEESRNGYGVEQQISHQQNFVSAGDTILVPYFY